MRILFAALALALTAMPIQAQFTGPSGSRGSEVNVAVANDARLGTYVTLTGHIVEHQRSDYFLFRDDTGDTRVEIPGSVWAGRAVGPEDRVRLTGEVSRSWRGRYIWVESLVVLE